MTSAAGLEVTFRIASPELEALEQLVFSRYPLREWGAFMRLGWRASAERLVLTLASIDPPLDGDLDHEVPNVAFQEPYSLRVALSAEHHPLAVGVVHSHPEGYAPLPSAIDDDMDLYYADYLSGFAPGRPFVSLVLSRVDNQTVATGRVFYLGRWHEVQRFAPTPTAPTHWQHFRIPRDRENPGRLQRLMDEFGEEAADRLRRSSVGIVGVGGTGSATAEILARAGVGRMVLVDPDHLEASNVERVHGSTLRDAASSAWKVVVARNHVLSIDPAIDVEAWLGRVPQESIVDALSTVDIVLGCTDRQHSRLALSDLALRYLVNVLDCGVLMEGRGGQATGQIIQLVDFLPASPCVLCLGMISHQRVAQEMMSQGERARRRAAAQDAQERGEDPNPYWADAPQLNTVGYLTTTAAGMVAGYAIGRLTGRFLPPFSRLQMNLLAPFLDVTDSPVSPRPECTCQRVRGWADQGAADALITAASHWPLARRVS